MNYDVRFTSGGRVHCTGAIVSPSRSIQVSAQKRLTMSTNATSSKSTDSGEGGLNQIKLNQKDFVTHRLPLDGTGIRAGCLSRFGRRTEMAYPTNSEYIPVNPQHIPVNPQYIPVNPTHLGEFFVKIAGNREIVCPIRPRMDSQGRTIRCRETRGRMPVLWVQADIDWFAAVLYRSHKIIGQRGQAPTRRRWACTLNLNN